MTDFVHGDGAEGQRHFEELLTHCFPGIAGEINEIERGLLHLEMAAFARATCAAIDNKDFKEVGAHLEFIDELFYDAAPDLENAIYVSYLENVFLGHDDERYRSARRLRARTCRRQGIKPYRISSRNGATRPHSAHRRALWAS